MTLDSLKSSDSEFSSLHSQHFIRYYHCHWLQGYAWEITTVEGGYGLHELLSSRRSVLNGMFMHFQHRITSVNKMSCYMIVRTPRLGYFSVNKRLTVWLQLSFHSQFLCLWFSNISTFFVVRNHKWHWCFWMGSIIRWTYWLPLLCWWSIWKGYKLSYSNHHLYSTIFPLYWSFLKLQLQAQCKAALQKELGLPIRPECPMVSIFVICVLAKADASLL